MTCVMASPCTSQTRPKHSNTASGQMNVTVNNHSLFSLSIPRLSDLTLRGGSSGRATFLISGAAVPSCYKARQQRSEQDGVLTEHK